MDKKKIIVTGGAGDIGRSVCDYFLENNYSVVQTGLNNEELSDLNNLSTRTIFSINLKHFPI